MLTPMSDPLALGDDLRAFVDAAPFPSHAVAEIVRRLSERGFRELSEVDRWELEPGDARYVVRHEGRVIAFRVGSHEPARNGFRILGAHTDSPGFRVRPRWDVQQAGYRLVGVEPYGAPLLYTWLDRDLTVAGQLVLRGGAVKPVVLPGAPLRLPSLAIHLDRDVNKKLALDPQLDLVPVWSIDDPTVDGLLKALAAQVGADADEIVGVDLALADTQPAARAGGDGSWVAAPRLDNLGSCHAGLLALLETSSTEHTPVLVCNDHEEIGSNSASGARGSFLADVLTRIVGAIGDPSADATRRSIAQSILVSADMSHALHPNHAKRHEPSHTPVLGGGPVLKVNASRSYATDAEGGAWFAERCSEAGVPLQHYVTRADLPCGSTIGPHAAARLGIRTIDLGASMLAMHSCRELASARDIPLMVRALATCLAI